MIFELSSNFKQYWSSVLYKDLWILYSHDKKKLSNGQLWKFWKETAYRTIKFGEELLIGLWSYFIDILAFELGKLCHGEGILFRFFYPGAGVLHWKAAPGRGFWRKNLVAGVGMVTGQIDTCITCHNQALATSGFCKGLCHAVAFLKRLNWDKRGEINNREFLFGLFLTIGRELSVSNHISWNFAFYFYFSFLFTFHFGF